jgi:membrane protease YdiL (CAAX protease family)
MLMLFGMGCVLAELFRRTGSLWTGIALHALNNAVATILLFSAR